MRRLVVTALAAGLLTATPVVPQPVEAATLLEALFPRAAERRARKRQARQQAYQRAVAAQKKRDRAARRRAANAKAKAKSSRKAKRKRSAAAVRVATVQGPQYNLYSAEQLRPVQLARLGKPFAAHAESAAATAEAEYIAKRDEALDAALAAGLSLDAAVALLPEKQLPAVQLTDGSAQLAAIELTARKANAAAVLAHYKSEPKFLWIGSDGRPTDNARAVMDVLADADAYGLRSSDYAISEPVVATTVAADSESGEAALTSVMRLEFELTTAALRYALDARHGLVDPDRISGYHDFPANKPEPAKALAALAAAEDPAKLLLGAHPQDDEFDAMRTTLAKLRAAGSEPAPIVVKPGTFLKPGMTSDQVPVLVEAIRRRAKSELLEVHAAVFAGPVGLEYSDAVVSLVRNFQKANGLGADGIVGKRTLAVLSPGADTNRLQKVLHAMERLRWHPDRLGANKVVINQPAYRATYYEGGREALSMRTVVGKPSNQTSFFHDTIDYVEFNPYWGVPKSILVNEMLPKLRRNPGHLDRLGYEITDLRGRPVSGWNVDWWGVGASFPYNVRQPPGPKNALGELKIMFPNKHAIYMHDTPARSLFKRTERAFSHGCVRLADPRAMAAAVLGSSVAHVDKRVAARRNRTEQLKSKIPVYVGYFTAWPDASGEMEYFADVYNRDKALAKALTAEHSARAKARAI